MNDEEFLKAFEACTLDGFHHADHIRMAWIYLREYGYEAGSKKIVDGIKRFAIAKNANTLYHETITQFWIRLVQHMIDTNSDIQSFTQFYECFPTLQDSKSILRHYSKPYLMSDAARNNWHDPDILPIP